LLFWSSARLMVVRLVSSTVNWVVMVALVPDVGVTLTVQSCPDPLTDVTVTPVENDRSSLVRPVTAWSKCNLTAVLLAWPSASPPTTVAV